jgi:16S rRNA (uracil1498-N3)-methyltransferase
MNAAKSEVQKVLPKAEFLSVQDGKKFSGEDSSNPSGLSVLNDATSVRKVLVFALGSNGGVSEEKINDVITRAKEIGAKKIVPFSSKNTIVKLTDKDKPKRVEKFKKIVEEACKQCGRTDDIEVDMIQDLKTIDFKESKVLFAYEASKDSLRNEINDIKEKSIKDIGIIIGPEGGFDSKEVEYLKQKDNIVEVSLGTRILRAETAALNLLSIVMYETEL